MDFYTKDLELIDGNAIKSLPPLGFHLAVVGDEATWDVEAATAPGHSPQTEALVPPIRHHSRRKKAVRQKEESSESKSLCTVALRPKESLEHRRPPIEPEEQASAGGVAPPQTPVRICSPPTCKSSSSIFLPNELHHQDEHTTGAKRCTRSSRPGTKTLRAY